MKNKFFLAVITAIVLALLFPLCIIILNYSLDVLMKINCIQSILSNNNTKDVLSLNNYVDNFLKIINMIIALYISYLLYKLNLNNTVEREQKAAYKTKKVLNEYILEIFNISIQTDHRLSVPPTLNEISPIFHVLNKQSKNYLIDLINELNRIYQTYSVSYSVDDIRDDCHHFISIYYKDQKKSDTVIDIEKAISRI